MAKCQIFAGTTISTTLIPQRDYKSVTCRDMIKAWLGTPIRPDTCLMFQTSITGTCPGVRPVTWLMFQATSTGTCSEGYIKGSTEADLDIFMLKVAKRMQSGNQPNVAKMQALLHSQLPTMEQQQEQAGDETPSNAGQSCSECGQDLPPKCSSCGQFVRRSEDDEESSSTSDQEIPEDDGEQKGFSIKESKHGVGHAWCHLCNRPAGSCPRCNNMYESEIEWTEDEESDDDTETEESTEDEDEEPEPKRRRHWSKHRGAEAKWWKGILILSIWSCSPEKIELMDNPSWDTCAPHITHLLDLH